MYLSNLQLVGFKSFAKKTDILFNPGITGIVGPNGCGKSNIVDAIRWVLGEQKAGVLRSEKMDNVIFSGAGKGRPLGMAEVNLIVQNTKNILPIDYTEVVVTRRLFRSGESQYLLNGAVCRLKDINDLFMDTGMGPDAYSVIELNMVESLLNGKADDRRHIFDEAAGITKYKERRKATYRKLEATEKDLQRLGDIIAEVEKTVRSLRRQVRRAQRYEKLSQNLRDLEIQLAKKRYSEYQSELTPLQAELSERREQRDKVSAQLTKMEAETEEAKTSLLDLERKLSSAQKQFNDAVAAIRTCEEEVLVGREQIRSLENRIELFGKDSTELQARLRKLQDHKATQENQLETIKIRVRDAEQSYDETRSRHEEARVRAEDLKKEFHAQEESRLGIIDELSENKAKLERDSAQSSALAERIQELDRERDENGQEIHNLEERLEDKKKELAEIERRLEKLRTEAESTRQGLDTLRAEIETKRNDELRLHNRLESLRDRAEILRRLIETHEDRPDSVRVLLTDAGEEFTTAGTLVDRLSVEEKYRQAIESALGDAQNYMVVADRQMAFQGIAVLREKNSGVASFVALRDIRSTTPADNAQVVQHSQGFVGWADRLVTCDEAYRPLVSALLGNVAIVEDRQAAERLLDSASTRGVDVVTLSGETFLGLGVIRGGGSARRDVGLLGRKEKLQETLRQIEDTDKSLADATETRHGKEAELADVDKAATQLTAKIQQHEAHLADCRVALGQLEFQVGSLRERQTTIHEEQQNLRQRIVEIEETLGELREHINQLNETKTTLTRRTEELRVEVDKADTELATLAKEVEEQHVELVGRRSEMESLESDIRRTEGLAAETEKGIETRTQESEQAKEEAAALAERISGLKKELQDKFADRESLEKVVLELEDKHRELKADTEQRDRRNREFRDERDKEAEVLHDLELRVNELTLKSENIRDRISDEFDFELEQVEVEEEFDPETAEEEIDVLRQKLKALGPVNMLALREYEQEKRRLDLMIEQRKDLLEARENLEVTIRRINETAREKFKEVFERIEGNFQQVFGEFFDGGQAELRLAVGEDPLEAEIKIVASPKGKRLESLSLLSGGEKALTAISLLFAIYLVKPSPFCILDEVDAPLDDLNVGRFVEALRKFAHNTQFITVTHNKLTMKAADYLYGVTMGEDNISKLVSVRFGEDDQVPDSEGASVKNT